MCSGNRETSVLCAGPSGNNETLGGDVANESDKALIAEFWGTDLRKTEIEELEKLLLDIVRHPNFPRTPCTWTPTTLINIATRPTSTFLRKSSRKRRILHNGHRCPSHVS